jgi:molybdenum cofactor sulfurtransferase
MNLFVEKLRALTRSHSDETRQRQRQFEKRFPDYAATSFFDDLRKTEYSRLDRNREIYLDYTGGSLYSETQLQKHLDFLQNSLLGNPHSTNPSSVRSTEWVEKTRKQVLEYFHAEEDYFCVFTPNASGALKIIGESYPFSAESNLLLSFDNHNSVNGIREFARAKGANFAYAPLKSPELTLDETALRGLLERPKSKGSSLFAFPAQSNVSGVKHSLEWIERAQQMGWDVLLDAAAYVPTSLLNLSEVRPDYVSLSFYKMFGYPTGIGALLIRKSAFEKLKKPWFAGGTVQLVSVKADDYFLSPNHERFEDGTLDYLGIPAVSIGLDHLQRIGIPALQKRLRILTHWVSEELLAMKHSNGKPLVRIFGPQDFNQRGATLTLNFYDASGFPIPFEKVEGWANARKISLRTGCFCNPGLDEINHGLSEEELAHYFSTHDRGNYREMMAFLGKLRGAVRISFGIASNWDDAEGFLSFAREVLANGNKTE